MARIVVVSGSPSAPSRTFRLLRHLGQNLSTEGFEVTSIDVRDLPAEDLVFARSSSPALVPAFSTIESAAGVVVGTPTYKAAYSGVLKTFLDVLPPRALSGKVVLPLMTGGTPAHALALDYALRPVLAALGASLITAGVFVLDKQIGEGDAGATTLEPDAERQLTECTLAFTRLLRP